MVKQFSVEQVQRLTGAEWGTLRDQYAASAQTLCEIAAKVRVTGKKFRGYTAEHAQAAADDMAARSAECSARSA